LFCRKRSNIPGRSKKEGIILDKSELYFTIHEKELWLKKVFIEIFPFRRSVAVPFPRKGVLTNNCLEKKEVEGKGFFSTRDGKKLRGGEPAFGGFRGRGGKTSPRGEKSFQGGSNPPPGGNHWIPRLLYRLPEKGANLKKAKKTIHLQEPVHNEVRGFDCFGKKRGWWGQS